MTRGSNERVIVKVETSERAGFAELKSLTCLHEASDSVVKLLDWDRLPTGGYIFVLEALQTKDSLRWSKLSLDEAKSRMVEILLVALLVIMISTSSALSYTYLKCLFLSRFCRKYTSSMLLISTSSRNISCETAMAG